MPIVNRKLSQRAYIKQSQAKWVHIHLVRVKVLFFAEATFETLKKLRSWIEDCCVLQLGNYFLGGFLCVRPFGYDRFVKIAKEVTRLGSKIDENVLGLDIAMTDSFWLENSQSCQDLKEKRANLGWLKRLQLFPPFLNVIDQILFILWHPDKHVDSFTESLFPTILDNTFTIQHFLDEHSSFLTILLDP